MKNKILIVIFISVLLILTGLLSFWGIREYQKAHRPYLYCNDHAITKPEYEYFYNSYKQFYINSFSNFFSYMGVDDSTDLEDQEYENVKTFGQMFQEETLEQIKETYALCDDAQLNGFVYDADTSFNEYFSMVEEACRASDTSPDKYFRQFYGPDCNVRLIREYMIRGFYAAAYYDHLISETSEDEAYIYVNELKKGYKTEYY